MKICTVQNVAFLKANENNDTLITDYRNKNFMSDEGYYYSWLKDQYQQRKSNVEFPYEHELLWVWEGEMEKDDYENSIGFEGEKLVYLEFEVPKEFEHIILWSDYVIWDWIFTGNSEDDESEWVKIFNTEHSVSIQGVLPFFKREWLVKEVYFEGTF